MMGKINIDLTETDTAAKQEAAGIAALAATLPSAGKSRRAALTAELRRAPRVQFAFSQVPKPIKDRFEAVARERGITMKELFYDCLRAGGIEIPEAAEIDGRRIAGSDP